MEIEQDLPVEKSPEEIISVPAPEPVVLIKQEPMINIFYKDGQNLDNCLIANSARRAELRKLRRQEQKETEQQQKSKIAQSNKSCSISTKSRQMS